MFGTKNRGPPHSRAGLCADLGALHSLEGRQACGSAAANNAKLTLSGSGLAIKRTRKRGVWARDWGWYLATVQLNVTVHPYTAIQKLHEPTGYLHGDGLESDLNVVVRVGSDEQGGQCVDQFADAVAIRTRSPQQCKPQVRRCIFGEDADTAERKRK